MGEDVSLEGEQSAVARAVESSRGLVVPQHAALVSADAGDGCEAPAVVDDEADGGRCREGDDLGVG